MAPDENAPPVFPDNPFRPNESGEGAVGEDSRAIDGPKVSLAELFSALFDMQGH